MYGASAHALKKSFNLPVGMVTDSDFAEIIKGLPMPYDFVSTELDDWGMDPRWWASPKFHIFKKYAPQNKKFYQMDTDVFFWDSMTVGDHVGLLVQSVEDEDGEIDGGVYGHSYKLPVNFFNSKLLSKGLTPEQLLPWSPTFKSAYNCGVVGFGKTDDAVEYASMAIKICEWMTPYLDEFMSSIPAKLRRGSAMVVPEQYFLRCFSADRNLYVAHVCEKMVSGKLTYFDPDDYYHAMAKKGDPNVRGRFREMVELEQPELFDAISIKYGSEC